MTLWPSHPNHGSASFDPAELALAPQSLPFVFRLWLVATPPSAPSDVHALQRAPRFIEHVDRARLFLSSGLEHGLESGLERRKAFRGQGRVWVCEIDRRVQDERGRLGQQDCRSRSALSEQLGDVRTVVDVGSAGQWLDVAVRGGHGGAGPVGQRAEQGEGCSGDGRA